MRRETRCAGLGADFAELELEKVRRRLGGVFSVKTALAELVKKVTDRRSHRKGDLNGINAVLLTGHNRLSMG